MGQKMENNHCNYEIRFGMELIALLLLGHVDY